MNRQNRVALTRRVLADLETPLSVYAKLAQGKNSFLLESVEGGEKWGRYSIIGLPAKRTLQISGRNLVIRDDDAIVDERELVDPLAFIEDYQAQFALAELDHLPRFCGGLVGYFGFDTVRYVEPRLAASAPPDPIGLPDIYLLQVDDFIVFDNLKGELVIVKTIDADDGGAVEAGEAELDSLVTRLREPLPDLLAQPPRYAGPLEFSSEFGEAMFLQAVERIKRYIVDGDAMQVVLAQRLSVDLGIPPIQIYRALRHLNPSPYLFYFDFENFHVVGSSPEILVRVEDGIVTTRPLAGTRPRGRNEAEDRQLERELLSDPKEIAEHLMLIDLHRNDVGRIAKVGSVKVTEQMVVERYSHVMHISSNVECELEQGYNAIDVLRATIPVGTLSGAPKIRAIEIIDELEPVRRGLYGGAVGYLSWNGDMDTAIAIRTALIKDQRLYVQAGCGVVADSVPSSEWTETMNKAGAIMKAVEMASSGLAPMS